MNLVDSYTLQELENLANSLATSFDTANHEYMIGAISEQEYNQRYTDMVEAIIAYDEFYLETHECECKPDGATACKTCCIQNNLMYYLHNRGEI